MMSRNTKPYYSLFLFFSPVYQMSQQVQLTTLHSLFYAKRLIDSPTLNSDLLPAHHHCLAPNLLIPWAPRLWYDFGDFTRKRYLGRHIAERNSETTEKFRNPSPNLGHVPGKVPSPPWTSFSLFTILRILGKHYVALHLWTVNF